LARVVLLGLQMEQSKELKAETVQILYLIPLLQPGAEVVELLAHLEVLLD
jgi:hypothetical protein